MPAGSRAFHDPFLAWSAAQSRPVRLPGLELRVQLPVRGPSIRSARQVIGAPRDMRTRRAVGATESFLLEQQRGASNVAVHQVHQVQGGGRARGPSRSQTGGRSEVLELDKLLEFGDGRIGSECRHRQVRMPWSEAGIARQLSGSMNTSMPPDLLRRAAARFNHALHLTRPSRSSCNPRVPSAGSLSLGR